jgi:hypothetical protein
MATKSKLLRRLPAMGVLLLGSFTALVTGQAPAQVPTVIDARVPFYPEIPQKAHIDGVVRLRITTDGRRPSSIDELSGQPMLLDAAVPSAVP